MEKKEQKCKNPQMIPSSMDEKNIISSNVPDFHWLLKDYLAALKESDKTESGDCYCE